MFIVRRRFKYKESIIFIVCLIIQYAATGINALTYICIAATLCAFIGSYISFKERNKLVLKCSEDFIECENADTGDFEVIKRKDIICVYLKSDFLVLRKWIKTQGKKKYCEDIYISLANIKEKPLIIESAVINFLENKALIWKLLGIIRCRYVS